MSKLPRSHFGEPNATTLFTELRNAKQTQNESAQKFVIRLMALRQKVLFVSNEDRCGYSEDLVQDRFLHAMLVGLRNDNRRYELRSLPKNSIFPDNNILENLVLASADERKHSNKFKGKQINISTIEVSEGMTHLPKDKSKISKTIHINQHSLQAKPSLPRRCQNCKTTNSKCTHCFYCCSREHLQSGCL